MILFLLQYWKFALLASLVAFGGLQTYRLQATVGKIALMEMREGERIKAAQIQALHNVKNKERTDAQYQLDLAAARRAGVRIGSKRAYVPAPIRPTTGGRPPGSVCYGAEQLNRELGAWAERLAGRVEAVARQAEEVAAAYRACRTWALEQNGVR